MTLHRSLLVLGVLTCAVLACGEKAETSASASAGSTGSNGIDSDGTDSASSSATTTTGTTDEPTSSTGAPNNTTELTTTTGEAGSSTGSSTSGGGVPPEVDAACMIACDRLFECINPAPFPTVDACKDECSAGIMGDACIAASVAFNTCLGTLTCEQVSDAVMLGDAGPCTDLLTTYMMTCQG